MDNILTYVRTAAALMRSDAKHVWLIGAFSIGIMACIVDTRQLIVIIIIGVCVAAFFENQRRLTLEDQGRKREHDLEIRRLENERLKMEVEKERLSVERDLEIQRLEKAKLDANTQLEKERLSVKRDLESESLQMERLKAEAEKQRSDLIRKQMEIAKEKLSLEREKVKAFEKIATATDTHEEDVTEQCGWFTTEPKRTHSKKSYGRYSRSDIERYGCQLSESHSLQSIQLLEIEDSKATSS